MTPDQLACLFHETYERLAPDYGYRTRKASAVPWEDVPAVNRALMVAVASEVLLAIEAMATPDADLEAVEATQAAADAWRERRRSVPDVAGGDVLADGTASMDRRQGTGPESFDCPEVAPAPEFVSADWWCPWLRAPTMKPGWCDHVGAPVVTWHLPRAGDPSVSDVPGSSGVMAHTMADLGDPAAEHGEYNGWCRVEGIPLKAVDCPECRKVLEDPAADAPSVPDVAGRDVSHQPPVPEGEGLLGWRD